MTTKTFKSPAAMLEWQWRSLVGELQLLQQHAADSTCPCTWADIGENCQAKHTLSIASLALETASMDEDNAALLYELAEDAQEQHQKVKAFVCQKGDMPDLVPFARQWRKRLEPLYYKTSCKMKLRQDFSYSEHSPKNIMIRSDTSGVVPPEYARFKVQLDLKRAPEWNIEDAPTLSTPESVQKLFSGMRNADREWLLIICLDTRLRLIGLYEQAIGTHDSAAVSPLEIARLVMKSGAVSVIMAHNHPSGDPKPSDEDRKIFNKMKEALAPFDVQVLDHIVVGHTADYSIVGNKTLLAPSVEPTPFTSSNFPPTCKVIKTHDDGDKTLKCKTGNFVVTTEGKTFKETQVKLFQCQLSQQLELAAARPIPKEQLPFDFENPIKPHSVIVPATATAPAKKYALFPYQAEGVAWLKGRSFALLADDMGLGKTPQAIHWGADNLPALVIVPAALTFNWQREIQTMWRPGDTAVILDGKENLPSKLPDWTIMSYGQVNKYLPELKKAGFRSLVVDEAHNIKNLDAQRTKNILELVAPSLPEPTDKLIPNRLAVTGTPVLNRPIELFALLVFLGVKKRGQYREFMERYTEHKEVKGRLIFTGAKNLSELHEYLKSFMLRRLKKDVLKQLPPKTNTPLYVAISNRDEYISAEQDFLGWLAEKAGDAAAFNASRAEIITRMNALRQLAAMGKVAPVCDWLKPCKDGQGKVIVFSTFNGPLEAMAQCKPDSLIYNGAVSSIDRQGMVDEFQKPEGPCYFLGTVGAAGVGITLTAASRVCFLDLPWTPGGKQQAEDRAHRIGQKNPVEIVNVLARGTIDERMLKLLADKEFIIAQTVDGKVQAEALSTSVAQNLMNDFMRTPRLNQNVVQYQPDPVDPDPGELAEIAEGFRQEKEVKRVESGPFNFILYSNGEFKVSSSGKFLSDSELKDRPKLLSEAKEKLGLSDNSVPSVSISGKCGASVDTCRFTIRRKGKPHIVTKEVEAAKFITCKAGVKDLAKQATGLLTDKKCSLRQEPTVTIKGKCSLAGCNLRVKGSVETLQAIDTPGLTAAINTVIHHFDTRAKPAPPSSRTFAPGISTSNRYEFEFKVVEASDLIVSHNPFTFELNPKYTAKIQPRIRERMANQWQVKKIAARLDPEKLLLDTKAIDTGSPIVGPDFIVECGNGRVMALILAAKEHPANIELYRNALKAVAINLGLPTAPIDKMKLPVLVRVRLTPVDRQAFAEECNARPTIETSAIEKARTDADKITPSMLGSLDVLEGEPVEKALRSDRNKSFVAAYLSKVPENEQAGLIDSRGYLSADGIRRMVMGIFTATFKGDVGIKLAEKFFEAIDETGVKNAFNGILKSLGIMAQAESLIASGAREPELTFGEDLAKAMTVFSNLRGADMSVANYLNQQQLEERALTPFQETVLKTLDEHTRSAKRIGAILTNYAQSVIDSTPPSQVAMIPGPKPEKAQLFDAAVKRALEEVEKRKEPEPAAMGCGLACLVQGHSWLAKKIDPCNLSVRDVDSALNWKPLREMVKEAVGMKLKVAICSIGLVYGIYQLTITGIKENTVADRLDSFSKNAGIRRVQTNNDNERVYEIVPARIPEAEDLTWTPQEVSHIPARAEGTQAAMFAKAKLADPMLAEIARELCTTGLCLASEGAKTLPTCTKAKGEKLEHCILQVKARNVSAGCKPEGDGTKKCPSAFAVCQSSLKCKKEKE